MNHSKESTNVSSTIEISNYLRQENNEDIIAEILAGLKADKKYLSSRFFYDETGSSLFEKITRLPEYYPTRTELSILRNNASEILASEDAPDIIELGSGDCTKISILFDAIPDRNLEFVKYYPVDVSEAAILKSAETLSQRYPAVRIHGLLADFMKHLDVIPGEGNRLFCFFGSTLGNLTREQALHFLKEIKSIMRPGDSFLLGLDRVKDIEILEAAYNDCKGITEAFNKNMLNVINGIISANFISGYFEHLAFYNREEARIEMHLGALQDMEIYSPHVEQNIIVDKGETIQTENSHKFTMEHITELVKSSGLAIKNTYSDKNNWFSLVHLKFPG